METQSPGRIFQKNNGLEQFPVAPGHLFYHANSHVNTNSEFWRITLFGKMNTLRPYQEVLQVLPGLRLAPLGAAADMLWLHFGEMRSVVDRKGKERKVGEWALHLQCPWRFMRLGTVVLGSSDFYYDAVTGEKYDWESKAESVFHRNSKELNRMIEAEKVTVSVARCTEAGAFDLVFDHDLKLSVMPVESSRHAYDESWRFFVPSGDLAHYVFPEIETEKPNKALVPTPASVTPAADAPVAPDAGAAHL